MKPLSLKQAKDLGNQFATELQKEFGTPLSWWFIGSIRERKYKPGQSDVDMVIIPRDKGMFGIKAIKRMLAKMEEYKKYGTVFKKGRDISLIDPLIIFNIEMVDKLRTQGRKKP